MEIGEIIIAIVVTIIIWWIAYGIAMLIWSALRCYKTRMRKFNALETRVLELREALAALEHDRWSGWMKYQFSCRAPGDFTYTWTVPLDKLERWRRQMKTPYHELSEQEKNSDRAEADRTIELLRKIGVL